MIVLHEWLHRLLHFVVHLIVTKQIGCSILKVFLATSHFVHLLLLLLYASDEIPLWLHVRAPCWFFFNHNASLSLQSFPRGRPSEWILAFRSRSWAFLLNVDREGLDRSVLCVGGDASHSLAKVIEQFFFEPLTYETAFVVLEILFVWCFLIGKNEILLDWSQVSLIEVQRCDIALLFIIRAILSSELFTLINGKELLTALFTNFLLRKLT